MAHLLFAFICLAWGLSFLLMKKAANSYGPLDIGAFRLLCGATVLWIIWFVKGGRFQVTNRDWLPLVMTAWIGSAFPFALQPYVIRQVQQTGGHGSAFVGMIIALVPLLTIAMSIPMLSLWPTRRQLTGIFGGLCFMVVLFRDELSHGVSLSLLGLAALTPLCYAFSNTFIKRRFSGMSPLLLSAITMTVSGLTLLPSCFALGSVQINDSFVVSTISLVILGVFGTGLAGYIFFHLVRIHGPLFASMVAYIIPCIAVIAGWADGESVTIGQLFSLVGILAMVALVQYRKRGSVTNAT